MAAKPQKTLFEAMQSSKGRLSRPAVRIEQPAATPVRESTGPISLSERVPPLASPRVLLMVGATVVAVALAWLVIHQATNRRGSPTIDEARQSDVQPDVVRNTGSSDVRTGDRLTYDPDAPTADGGVAPPPEPGNTASAGAWRVRICRSPVVYKKDFDAAVKFLKDHGVETYQEFNSGFWFLYSKQGFPSSADPEGQKLLSRIKELGKAFPESSGTNTDFHDAYILKKPIL